MADVILRIRALGGSAPFNQQMPSAYVLTNVIALQLSSASELESL